MQNRSGGNRRVLVTGGKGFVGSWVVRDLQKQGLTPVVYDLADKSFVLPMMADPVQVVDGDVTDLESLIAALKDSKAEVIIHTAALTNVEKTQSKPEETIRINIQGTLNVLEAARRLGVRRVVYTSSRGVIGHIDDSYGHPHYLPVDEAYRCRPYTVYGSTKFFCECLGANYARMYGLQFCSLRFSMIYGPGKRPTHGSGAFHSVLIEEGLAGRAVAVPRGRDQKDDLIYVADVARAIVLAALSSKLSYDVYHIGTGVASTPVDFADAIKGLLPQARIEIGEGLDYLERGYQNYCIFDISRAKEDLGYHPEYSIMDGIRDYLERLRGDLSVGYLTGKAVTEDCEVEQRQGETN